MANEFRIKNGLIDSSLSGNSIIETNSDKKYVESGKRFNDDGTTTNDIWSANKVISSISTSNTNNIITLNNVSEATTLPVDPQNLIYVLETETFYRYELYGGLYDVNNFSILNTNDGDDTRYIGIAGKYTEILSAEQVSMSELTGIPVNELPKFTID